MSNQLSSPIPTFGGIERGEGWFESTLRFWRDGLLNTSIQFLLIYKYHTTYVYCEAAVNFAIGSR